MGWNVREVHQEQVQVGTARQAAYVQQETIINHADNHPMWNADKHVLLTTTSVFIEYEYLACFPNSAQSNSELQTDCIRIALTITFYCCWLAYNKTDKIGVWWVIMWVTRICFEKWYLYSYSMSQSRILSPFLKSLLIREPHWNHHLIGFKIYQRHYAILNLPVKTKNDGSFAQARTPNQIQEWPPTGAVSFGFHLTLVIFCKFCHYGIWVHGQRTLASVLHQNCMRLNQMTFSS